MVLDVVLEVHRAVKTGADDLSDVGTRQKEPPHAPLNPVVRRQRKSVSRPASREGLCRP